MPQGKITDENSLDRAVKRAHKQVQTVAQKSKAAKKELAAARRAFDEKVPDNTSDEDKKKYDQIASSVRVIIDRDIKRSFAELDWMIKDLHSTLKRLSS